MAGLKSKGLISKTSKNKHALLKESVMCHKPSRDSDTRDNNKRHKCESCEKSFQNRSSLFLHLRTHTGEKPYKCKICQSQFSRKDVLACHTRSHTGEKPYKCEYCHKEFASLSNRINHTRTHTGEKPFECRFCDYSSTQKSNITSHEWIHTGEKPYKCQFCSFSTVHRHNLRQHESIHSDGGRIDGSGRLYQCPTCPKVHHYKTSLHYHKKTHMRGKQLKDTLSDYSSSSRIADVFHEERLPKATGNNPFQTENSPTITKRPFCSFSQKIRMVQEHANVGADQQRSPNGSSYSLCRACSFSATTDTDLALHMSVLHKLPVVSLRRLSVIWI